MQEQKKTKGMSNYMRFLQHKRAENKKLETPLASRELTKVAGAEWRSKSNDEKAEWNAPVVEETKDVAEAVEEAVKETKDVSEKKEKKTKPKTKMKKAELVEVADSMGLDTSGTKADIIERITKA